MFFKDRFFALIASKNILLIAFCFVVSLNFSIITYIYFGRLIDISYLVSVSLAVTGGIWSYLSIEHNRVKEHRGEYLSQMKDIEDASLDYTVQAIALCNEIVKSVLYSGDEKKRNKIFLLEERTELIKKQNIFVYRVINAENNQFNDKDFSKLEGLISSFSDSVSDKVELIIGEEFNIKSYNEDAVLKEHRDIMKEMNSVFSNTAISFEEFSESYLYKKFFCFSIIGVCINTVIIKSLF